jgi:hypothetical protein
MPQIARAVSTTKQAFRNPWVEVYIGGRYRSDCLVDDITQASGFSPSSATIRFPGVRWPSRVVGLSTSVVIYINRWEDNRPKFRGYVAGFRQITDRQDDVAIYAYDERGRLNDDCCAGDFNPLDWESNLTSESLSARAIVNEIHGDYQTYQQANSNANFLQIDLGAFGITQLGVVNVEGTPHGSAIEAVQRQADIDYRTRTMIRPGVSRDTLTTFRIGSGPVKDIFYATKDTTAPSGQPHGYPMASSIAYQEGDENAINQIVAKGRRKQITKTLTLTAAWDATIQTAVLSDRKIYTQKFDKYGDPNPDYDSRAQHVATRWLIPTVTMTNPRTGDSESVQPQILGELFDQDPDNATKKARPVVIVKYATEASAVAFLTGFSVSGGKWISFSEPQVKKTVVDVGGTPTKTLEVPEYVKLVAVYEDQIRLSESVSLTSKIGRNRRGRVQNEGYIYQQYASGSYQLESDGTLTLVGSNTDFADDGDSLNDWGTARASEVNVRNMRMSIVLPQCPTYFNIGDRIRLNGWIIEDMAVVEIRYEAMNQRPNGSTVILTMGN